MLVNRAKALSFVLRSEGGNVDDPKDPGGRTSRGITQKTYDWFRSHRKLPRADVFRASSVEVADIYTEQYMTPVRFDDLPRGIDYAVFDTAVNSGPVTAIKWMQKTLGIRADGVVGLETLSAINRYTSISVVEAYLEYRLGVYRHLPTWLRFGGGWTNRMHDVLRGSKSLMTTT